MFERQHVSDLRNRLAEPRRTIIALTGPRQVGKTTIVRQALNDIKIPVIYENADESDLQTGGLRISGLVPARPLRAVQR